MATRLADHFDTLKSKPEHVRRRVAAAASAGITGIVALTWVVTMVSTGGFSLAGNTSVAEAGGTGDVKQALAGTKNTFSLLMGAAGAAFGASTTPAALTIVETNTSSTLDAKTPTPSDQTSIPF